MFARTNWQHACGTFSLALSLRHITPARRSCWRLSILYYEPTDETEQTLDLMRQIDEPFLETPLFGVRQMTWHLRNDGHLVNEGYVG